MARVRMLTGTRHSDREARIDEIIAHHGSNACLILPHRFYAEQRKATYFSRPGVNGAWGYRPISTFDGFVRDLLAANNIAARDLHPGEGRLVVERAIAMAEEAGALNALGDVVHTDGFASHMAEVIRLLKQGFVEPPVFTDFSKRNDSGVFDSAVAAIYAAYQILLNDKDAFDADGLYWAAYEVLKRSDVAGLKPVIAFDGFDEFTRAQLRVIENLAIHTEEIVFGIAIDDAESSRDRDAIALSTRSAILDLFPAVPMEACDESDLTTASAYTAAHIFWRDQPTRTEGKQKNLEFLPQANALDEMETVARRVKALMRNGVAANAIAVVARDTADYALLWRDVCGSFHVPTRIAHRFALTQSSIGRYIVQLIETLDHWERDPVVDITASPWFPHGEADPQETFSILARAAGIIAGRREWPRRLDALNTAIESGRMRDLPSAPDWPRALASFIDAVEVLTKVETVLPSKATRSDYARGLLEVVDTWSIRDRAETIEGSWFDEDAAVSALCRLLDRIAADDAETEHTTRPEFLQYLRRVMSEVTLPSTDKKGVLFASADQVRHCRFDHVFIVGAVEGSVPRPPRVNAVYSDADFERMNRREIAVRPPAHRIDFEMLLFARAMETANVHLCITWPTLGVDGNALLPSPYVRELLSWTVDRGLADEVDAPRFANTIAAPETVASESDLIRSAAADRAFDRFEWVSRAEFVRAGVNIEEARGDIAPMGPYDAVLSDKKNIESIAADFGSDHIFSVSQLETYTSCPFRFFEERVLAIAEVPVPEDTFDPMLSGSIMHRALENFHKHYRGQSIADIQAAGEFESARERMSEFLEEAFARAVYPGLPVADGAVALERRRLTARLDRYLLHGVSKKDADWKPSAFEVGFGTRDEDGAPDALGPFAITIDDEQLLFAGKIDRIDEGNEGWRIVDYKSSVHWAQSDFDNGHALQLGLYAMAFEQHIAEDSKCVDAIFLPVGSDKRVSAIFYNRKSRRAERDAVVRQAIVDAVRNIRAGRFHPPVDGEKCFGCTERRACRFDAARMTRKTDSGAGA